MSASVENLIRSLYRLGIVQRKIAQVTLVEMESQGFNALALLQGEGPLRVSQIASRLGIDISVASRQVRALALKRFVQIRQDKGDARAIQVSITDPGVEILDRCHGRLVEILSVALVDWGPEEVDDVTNQLDKLRSDFAAVLRNPAEAAS